MRNLKHCLLQLAAAMAVIGSPALHAQSTATHFTLPAQPLADALRAVGTQANTSVVFDPVLVEGKRAPAIDAQMSLDQALAKLLAGTGITHQFLNERTVVLAAARGRKSTAARAPVSQIRLAQAESQGVEPVEPADPADSDPVVAGVPELLVKGKRTTNVDIRRTEDDVQPYVVFTAEDIAHSMAGSLDQFLMARLPMNTSRFRANDIGDVPTNGNISSIDLRGLGPNQTLILVNGRRMPGVSTSNDLTQPDINGIPMSSIERIEVLPATAGGIYGGGATGGVINIILKSDYQGLQVNARYDGTFRRDAAERVLEASGGFSLEGGRTTVMLSGSYRDSIPLLWGDRDYAVRGRQQLLANNPAAVLNGSVPPLGATTNIRSQDGSPLVLASTGQSLGSSITHVPRGYAGPATDGGAALVANAGQYNLDWPAGTQGLGKGMTSAPEVTSFRLNARRDFTDRIEVFFDGSLSRNDSVADSYDTPQSFFGIEPGNPNNPFLQPINIRFPGSDFNTDTQALATSEVLNFTGGAIVRLPRGWTAQGEYGWGRSERDYAVNQNSGAFEDPVYFGDLVVLRDVEAYPLDYTPYLPPTSFTTYQPEPLGSDTESMALRLAGPTFDLPGGPVMLSSLLEQRRDTVKASLWGFYDTFGGDWFYQYVPSRHKTTRSAYMEVTAPLISAANARALVRALDVQASYRRDDVETRAVANTTQSAFFLTSPDDPRPQAQYRTTSVSADQYTLGLRYQPAESLALRVSNAVGVLPPSLQQLVPQIRNNVNVFLFDRKRRNPLTGQDDRVGVVSVYQRVGNPELAPERSNSWSAGAIFTPAVLPGLRLALDYTRIRKSDEIASLFPEQIIMDLEDAFPGRVQRAALTPADAALGYTVGRVQILNTSQVNLARTRVEAWDLSAGYGIDTAYGFLQFDAVATRQTHLQKQILPTSPLEESVGTYYGPLKFRGNAGLTWSRGAWALAWNTQYFDSIGVSSEDGGLGGDGVLNQGARFIRSQTYHDLSFRYRTGEARQWGGIFSNVELLVGIANILDDEPPISTVEGIFAGGFEPFQAPYGDPRLRRYSISVSKSFGPGG